MKWNVSGLALKPLSVNHSSIDFCIRAKWTKPHFLWNVFISSCYDHQFVIIALFIGFLIPDRYFSKPISFLNIAYTLNLLFAFLTVSNGETILYV